MVSQLEAGFIIRRITPVATDTAPGFALEQTGGNGFAIISGARKGFRLFTVRNNVDTELDVDLIDGMSWACKFDSLKLVSNTVESQLHGANNEGDDQDLVVAIFTDQRVLTNYANREGWIRRTDVARVSFQSIAADAVYVVWDDIPSNNTGGGGTGNGYPGTPWVDRLQTGSSDGVSGPPFTRPMMLKPTYSFSTSTGGIATAPDLAIWAYVDRDNPGSGEYLFERFSFTQQIYRGTTHWLVNSNRTATLALQHGLIWPSGGGRLEIYNPLANPAIGVRGFLGFTGQT